jgi:hypothetical protein
MQFRWKRTAPHRKLWSRHSTSANKQMAAQSLNYRLNVWIVILLAVAIGHIRLTMMMAGVLRRGDNFTICQTLCEIVKKDFILWQI